LKRFKPVTGFFSALFLLPLVFKKRRPTRSEGTSDNYYYVELPKFAEVFFSQPLRSKPGDLKKERKRSYEKRQATKIELT